MQQHGGIFVANGKIDVASVLQSSYSRFVAKGQKNFQKMFSAYLSKLIEDRGWEVGELARRVGIDRTTVYRHLKGETMPHRNIRQHYAGLFGFTIEDFDAEWRGVPSSRRPKDSVAVFLPKDLVAQSQQLSREAGIDLSDYVGRLLRWLMDQDEMTKNLVRKGVRETPPAPDAHLRHGKKPAAPQHPTSNSHS